jgi:hypothetical protein
MGFRMLFSQSMSLGHRRIDGRTWFVIVIDRRLKRLCWRDGWRRREFDSSHWRWFDCILALGAGAGPGLGPQVMAHTAAQGAIDQFFGRCQDGSPLSQQTGEVFAQRVHRGWLISGHVLV